MEKPVAVDGAGVRMVLAAAEEAKKKNLAIGVGLQRRHQTAYIETIKRLQDGAIGDIVYSRVYWNGGGVWTRERLPGESEMAYQMRNWYYFTWLCGDHIVEQHIHNLDVINWLTGKYPHQGQRHGRPRSAHRQRIRPDFRSPRRRVRIRRRHADDQPVPPPCPTLGAASPSMWPAPRERATSAAARSPAPIPGSTVHKGDRDPYQVEHDVLLESIRSGNPINEGEYGAKSSMTAILGRLATYSGKIVTWEEALNSQLRLAPADQKYTFDATPPVLPDENGNYPVAVPGVTQVV